jgi:hypothetical protein
MTLRRDRFHCDSWVARIADFNPVRVEFDCLGGGEGETKGAGVEICFVTADV